MGMQEEMKKFKGLGTISGKFTDTDKGVGVALEVHATQAHVEAMIKSLIMTISKDSKRHPIDVVSEIISEMLLQEKMKGGDND